jgi:hypothetical protein
MTIIKLRFILGDEVEGMMAEDKNVLINTKQNKKTYELPIELWNIVKSYSLQPPSVHQAIEKKCEIYMMKTWKRWISIYGPPDFNNVRRDNSFDFDYWYELRKYLHSQGLKNRLQSYQSYELRFSHKQIVKVLNSKAKKAKAEALELLTDAVKATQKKYKERKHYYYFSNNEDAVLTRKLYAGDLADEMPRMDKYDKECYEEYKQTLTLLNL